MVKYIFENPKKEGKIKGEDFWVVEISEVVGTHTIRRSKITLKDAKWLLSKAITNPYDTQKVEELIRKVNRDG
jgi:hypothetical protein